jgi:hypothetical protein
MSLIFDPIEKQPENNVVVLRAKNDNGKDYQKTISTKDSSGMKRSEEDLDADVRAAYIELNAKYLSDLAEQQVIDAEIAAFDTDFATVLTAYGVSKMVDENGNIINAS